MAQRVTVGMLKARAEWLNKMTDSPSRYRIHEGYLGCELLKVSSNGGGEVNVFGHGHIPKRELLEQMTAYEAGLCDGRGMAP